MVIDDLIVLGRACPEPTSDGRTTVCLGGYSYDHGFIRIYPTKIDTPIHRWDIVAAEVERNPKDSRRESWKIVDSHEGWDGLNKNIEKLGEFPSENRLSLVDSIADSCVNVINARKDSLGVIKPIDISPYFRPNPKHGGFYQLVMPMLAVKASVKRDFIQEPRFRYTCTSCLAKKGHDQQVLEWGVYRFMEKYPDRYEEVWGALLLTNERYCHYLFVGNQAQHRSSFMVISVLRFKDVAVQIPML